MAFLVVLAGYVVSLAPTVTFWDAGEFITAAHTLGIPHPPGTPVFVLLGRAFDALVPGLSTAVTTNLMSALFSAGSAALLFLLVHQSLAAAAAGLPSSSARLVSVGGAFAATVCAAFTFTVWQNSNETEVYQVAMFSIALIAWCCWLWRRDRGTARGAHLLLLVCYLFAVSLGNHLMALLAGPAVVAFLVHVLRTAPAREAAERGAQWAQTAVVATLWVTMVGVGTGNAQLAAAGGGLALAASLWAVRARTGLFALAAALVAVAGLSTYAFLYVRAGLQPRLNIGDPSSLQAVWDVISRRQYPARSPLDDPLFLTGPDNPGRTLSLLGLQIANYLQYFEWQWSAALQRLQPVFAPARLPFALLFAALGAYGAARLRRWDPSAFWLLGVLFLTTGLGLVLYLNFKPGFSIGLEQYPGFGQREVRERDYFFTASFVVWGLFAGLGLAGITRLLLERFPRRALPAAAVLLAAALPFALNFQAAGRRHGSAATLARDFAYDLLQSVEPYGILVTGGDNEVYPLWYLQEVEGVRRDVQVVITSLSNTDWYLRQLRDSVQRHYEPDLAAAALYPVPAGGGAGCTPGQEELVRSWAAQAGRHLDDPGARRACVHTMSDAEIAGVTAFAHQLPADYLFRAGTMERRYPAGTVLQPGEVALLRMIQENLGRRPIHVATSAGGGALLGLEGWAVRQGLTWKLDPDRALSGAGLERIGDTLVDVGLTRRLAWSVFRHAALLDSSGPAPEPTEQAISFALSQVYVVLAEAASRRGDREELVSNLRRAYRLFPDPSLARALAGAELPS